MDRETSAAVHMQPRAQVAFAVEGASSVDTSVLAASIMDLALIDIITGFAIFV